VHTHIEDVIALCVMDALYAVGQGAEGEMGFLMRNLCSCPLHMHVQGLSRWTSWQNTLTATRLRQDVLNQDIEVIELNEKQKKEKR